MFKVGDRVKRIKSSKYYMDESYNDKMLIGTIWTVKSFASGNIETLEDSGHTGEYWTASYFRLATKLEEIL